MGLRPYQAQALSEIDEALRTYQKALFVAPTGSGKGFMLGAICERYTKEYKRILVLSTRSEILMQNVKYVENFGISVAYVNPKVKMPPTAQVVVAMAQTLKRRVEISEWRNWLKDFDLIICDEAQECTSDFIHQNIAANAWVLGLSGSPQRYGGMTQLGTLYNCIVESVDIPTLIEQGYLSKCKLYSIVAPNLDDVAVDSNTKEYNQKQLAKKYEDKRLYVGVVDEYMQICPRAKTICFCVSAEQAIATTKEFEARGIHAKYVLSGTFDSDETYSGERTEIFEQFKRGDFQVLVNVGVAVAGLDVPSIECVIQNYATTSLVKHLQSLGRGSRVCEGKSEFIVLDAGQNYKRLGRYEQKRTWSLWHDTSSGTGVQQLKLCDSTTKDRNGRYGCGQMVPSTCSVCPCCGKVLVDKQWDYQCHLEEVIENTENDIEKWCCARKLEGWSIPRIMISLCIANPDNMRKAFIIGFKAISGKTDKEAGKYFFVFQKQFGDKIKRKKPTPKDDKIQEINF